MDEIRWIIFLPDPATRGETAKFTGLSRPV
jgi:hypothetical protein